VSFKGKVRLEKQAAAIRKLIISKVYPSSLLHIHLYFILFDLSASSDSVQTFSLGVVSLDKLPDHNQAKRKRMIRENR